MRVLALDTTTREGSVALVENDRVVAEQLGESGRSHAERLPSDLVNLLITSGRSMSDVDVFAVAAGPGSFTGLRIGIATIQGLAFVNRKRTVPLSVLEALAQAGSRGLAPGSLVGALIDAHRGEVFSALYEVTDQPLFTLARLIERDAATVGDPVATLSRWVGQFGAVSLFVGNGAVTYADVVAAPERIKPFPLLASTIGLMAVSRAQNGDTVDPAAIRPLYVRRPDAELDRERKNAMQQRTPC